MTHILHSPLSSTSCLHCTVYNKQALPTLCLIFRPQPLSTATCLPSNAPHAETPTHGLNFRHSLWTPVFKKKRLTWQRNLTKKLNSYATLRALTCNIRYLAAIHLTYLSRWVCMAITHIYHRWKWWSLKVDQLSGKSCHYRVIEAVNTCSVLARCQLSIKTNSKLNFSLNILIYMRLSRRTMQRRLQTQGGMQLGINATMKDDRN